MADGTALPQRAARPDRAYQRRALVASGCRLTDVIRPAVADGGNSLRPLSIPHEQTTRRPRGAGIRGL